MVSRSQRACRRVPAVTAQVRCNYEHMSSSCTCVFLLVMDAYSQALQTDTHTHTILYYTYETTQLAYHTLYVYCNQVLAFACGVWAGAIPIFQPDATRHGAPSSSLLRAMSLPSV